MAFDLRMRLKNISEPNGSIKGIITANMKSPKSKKKVLSTSDILAEGTARFL